MITNPYVGQKVKDLCFWFAPIGTIIEILSDVSCPYIVISHETGQLGSFRRFRFPHELSAFEQTPEEKEQCEREKYADQYL